MDPFHVVRLAGESPDRCHPRIQQETLGHGSRTGDPLYAARPTLHTGHDLLTEKQTSRLEALFAPDDHAEVEATWASTSVSSPPTGTRTGPAVGP